ncbi:MAG: transcription termination factor Rho [Synergistales bacterium]|nr:transcription termination factor Rho [Synergistales bacterium]
MTDNNPEISTAEATNESSQKETPPAKSNGNGNNGEAKSVPKPRYSYTRLSGLITTELKQIAKELGVNGVSALRKDDLILAMLKKQAENMKYRFGGGTLEILNEGYGFLRPQGLLPSDNDIYVSASQIRRFGLRNGDVVWGLVRQPKEQEHYEALLRVEMVNFSDPEDARKRPNFGQLTPIFPNERLNIETATREISTRLVDLFSPIGKGQRALLVSPPKAGKTTLLKNIAHGITTNHSEIFLMVLLIDERPEEVTDMSRSVDGEIIASTFDRPAEEHLRVANLALEKAKRLVEVGKDVVLLLDSITRLARASNLVVPPSGRTLSGGMDPAALYFPKRFFGAARNIEEGGSLTIIGTALVDTGSRMDDVIYEEFKGTGNMELHLSRKLSEQRIFPAMDITRSGTRREELLINEEDLEKIWLLRRRIVNVDEAGALNLIIDKLKQSKSNLEFLKTIKKS